MSSVFLDSFSGGVAALPASQRRDEALVMCALLADPKVSCFDRSEYPALDRTLVDLKKRGLICEVHAAYPWHRFHVTPEGLEVLANLSAIMNPKGRP